MGSGNLFGFYVAGFLMGMGVTAPTMEKIITSPNNPIMKKTDSLTILTNQLSYDVDSLTKENNVLENALENINKPCYEVILNRRNVVDSTVLDVSKEFSRVYFHSRVKDKCGNVRKIPQHPMILDEGYRSP